jgi:hypothetical protein
LEVEAELFGRAGGEVGDVLEDQRRFAGIGSVGDLLRRNRAAPGVGHPFGQDDPEAEVVAVGLRVGVVGGDTDVDRIAKQGGGGADRRRDVGGAVRLGGGGQSQQGDQSHRREDRKTPRYFAKYPCRLKVHDPPKLVD